MTTSTGNLSDALTQCRHGYYSECLQCGLGSDGRVLTSEEISILPYCWRCHECNSTIPMNTLFCRESCEREFAVRLDYVNGRPLP